MAFKKCFVCDAEALTGFTPCFITWNGENRSGGWHYTTDYELQNESEDFDVEEKFFCEDCLRVK